MMCRATRMPIGCANYSPRGDERFSARELCGGTIASLYYGVSQQRSRRRRILGALGRSLVYTVVLLLVVFGVALSALETSWGKDRLRQLILLQANQYLTAQLDIARLEGSLLRGLELSDIRLPRDGRTIISIDGVGLRSRLLEVVDRGSSVP